MLLQKDLIGMISKYGRTRQFEIHLAASYFKLFFGKKLVACGLKHKAIYHRYVPNLATRFRKRIEFHP
jgi:hypothetical protein